MVAALTAYNALTQDRTRFLRVDELCRRAAEQFPDPRHCAVLQIVMLAGLTALRSCNR